MKKFRMILIIFAAVCLVPVFCIEAKEPIVDLGNGKIAFGSWPQTKVDLTDRQIAALVPTGRLFQGNQEYKSNDGSRYVKVTATTAEKIIDTAEEYKFSDGTCVVDGDEYYFKVQPIVWVRLENTSRFIAEKALTSRIEYYDHEDDRIIDGKIIYANNYEHSKIRAFLNGLAYSKGGSVSREFEDNGFLQLAFTEEELLKIKIEKVRNDGASTTDSAENILEAEDYMCGPTDDRIYLLSEQEATDSNLGFDSYDMYSDGESINNRMKKATDYAIAMKCFSHTLKVEYSYKGCVCWWLRSPCFSGSNYARIVHPFGLANNFDYVNGRKNYYGVVPALTIAE